MLANRPESADTDFKWSDLAAKNNGELLANLGNFINRGLSFVYAKYGPLSNLYRTLGLCSLSMPNMALWLTYTEPFDLPERKCWLAVGMIDCDSPFDDSKDAPLTD